MNRDRFLSGQPIRGLRQVEIPNSTDQQDRKLTTLRKEAEQAQTQLVNRVKHLLRKHNLQWELPTKTFPTARAVAWLRTLGLPEIDRMEMGFLLDDLVRIQLRLGQLEKLIAERGRDNRCAQLLKTMPGIGGFTAISLASLIGNVSRFPRARSLANYGGLTPGCRNSGESGQRLGRITKAGSNTARWLLAQVAYQALRKDGRLREWYKRIKRRRGSGIARGAVMRKLTTVIWQMLKRQQTYMECRSAVAA